MALLRKCRFYEADDVWMGVADLATMGTEQSSTQGCTLHWGGGGRQLPAEGLTFALFKIESFN